MLELFLSFAKIGVMTFGGGLAMLPMLERELVANKHWISEEDLQDYYAIGQCTPGIIAVNVATFVGKRQKGFGGALCATLGVIFPSIVIITVLAAFFANFADIPAVQHAFAGARVCVCALVLKSVLNMGKKNIKDWLCVIIYVICLISAAVLGVSPALMVVLAAITGLLFYKEGGKTK